MTPKRKAFLIQKTHDTGVHLQGALDNGKKIPNLEVIINLYKILEEVVKACPVEAG